MSYAPSFGAAATRRSFLADGGAGGRARTDYLRVTSSALCLVSYAGELVGTAAPDVRGLITCRGGGSGCGPVPHCIGVSAAGLEPALATPSTSCLFPLGYVDVGGRAGLDDPHLRALCPAFWLVHQPYHGTSVP